LASVLLGICQEKRLQVICSTHSGIFLDNLPRQARLLIRRAGNDHFAYEAPSTRFAMQELIGEAVPEIVIYCEDQVAATLVEEALPGNTRARCLIRAVGSAATVVRQGVAHLRSGYEMRALCVLDGDQRDGEISNWIATETGNADTPSLDYIILPGGGSSPERWAVEQLRNTSYRDEFARQLSCSVMDAQGHIEAMSVELDHHDIGFVLHRRTNLDAHDCIRRTMRAFAARHPQLDNLRERVTSIID